MQTAPRLTPKQQRFVHAYLGNGHCAAKAAIEAGYSEKNAATRGHLNLRIPKIEAAIREQLEREWAAYKVSRESLALEYDGAAVLAKQEKDVRGLVQAITGKAKLFGLDIQKIEGVFSLVDLLDDE